MAEEIEIKLISEDAGILRDVFNLPLIQPFVRYGPETVALKANYIDTPGLDLAEKGFAFRMRKEGDQWKATIKRGRSYNHGLYVRDEWEVEVEYPTINFDIFQDSGLIKSLKTLVGEKQLIVLFEVDVHRTWALLIFRDGTGIEVVVDEGKIKSYGLEERVFEMEMELKTGSRKRLIALGESLKQAYALKEGKQSKYIRGLKLFRKAVERNVVRDFFTRVEGFAGFQ